MTRTMILGLLTAVALGAGCSDDGSSDAEEDAGNDAGDDAGGDGGGDDTDTENLSWEHELTVDAKAYWVSSGVFLREGQPFVIAAEGSWTTWEGNYEEHGPEGQGGDLGGCPYGALVAQVGLHWNDSPFCFADGPSFVAPRDGILYLGCNDGGREDNAGTMDVTIWSDGDESPTVDLADVAGYDYDAVEADMLELRGEHIILTLSTDHVASRADDAALSLAEFDVWYDLQEQLSGAVPYGGQPVRYFPDADIGDIGAWGLSGNPIRIWDEDGFLDVHDHEYSVWGYVHELGHDFSFINGGAYMSDGGPIEGWGNIWTTYTLEAQDRPEAPRWQDQCESADLDTYLESGTYEQFAEDAWLPLCLLMGIQTTYGWEMYEEFFATMFALPADEQVGWNDTVPERWGFVRDLMNAITGDDLTPTFLAYHIPLPD